MNGRHNDEMIADNIKTGIDALQILAKYRLDFIEERGLTQDYLEFMKEKAILLKKERVK